MTESSIRKVQGEEMFDAMHLLYGYSFKGSPPLASMPDHTRQKALEWHADARDEGAAFSALYLARVFLRAPRCGACEGASWNRIE